MDLTLRQLEAKFYKYAPGVLTPVDSLSEADGVCFLCPKCFVKNGGAVGTHWHLCWFEDRVPDSANPGPGRWNPRGTGLDDLSFVPGKKTASVLALTGCRAHFFVTDGRIKNCD